MLPSTKPTAKECSEICEELVSCVGFVYAHQNSICFIKLICDISTLQNTNSANVYRTYIKTGMFCVSCNKFE